MPADPRAVLTQPSPPPDATVAYGDHPDQLADLRRPAGDGPPRPLVVVVHGGFWRAEYDRGHTGPMAAALAALGHPVAQLEYRRTGQPDGGWPNTLTDVLAGVAALPALAAAALPGRVAPGPPILVGHSAGGHLALYAAAHDPAAVAGVLALAPVADLAEAYRLDLDGGAVAALLGGGPTEFPDRYAAADPSALVPIRVRTVVMHGRLDQQVPIGISRSWVAAARSTGSPTSLLELPECEHFGLIAPDSAAWPRVVAALRSLHDDLPPIDAASRSR
ncbi:MULTISPECIES: S9 family peptidase [Micromonospora]|uniref:Alpha/beta fold hydrolase n=1 Tax=Micromonospora solifontis TaxID=2487138 RepID=A0ABX9WI73_9ACTN|nr:MULTISPECIES: alpha/beta hydrolase [Micromonospora]NES16379.1 alpha/beta fold hydrolase [Micromonospora sp. PPF5-17B]NES36229.1 alpha/beta fold hydrolase [Micromonospora solifontis]NES57980.1 alpha/beta fold hydrolase [Micromonospora sp. PPF5-6]RNL99817.1 alpha/beta fold hydrolase [Micromonospora solifontis]